MTGIAAASFFSNTCRFGGCGLHFPTLAELIEHIEDNHIGECSGGGGGGGRVVVGSWETPKHARTAGGRERHGVQSERARGGAWGAREPARQAGCSGVGVGMNGREGGREGRGLAGRWHEAGGCAGLTAAGAKAHAIPLRLFAKASEFALAAAKRHDPEEEDGPAARRLLLPPRLWLSGLRGGSRQPPPPRRPFRFLRLLLPLQRLLRPVSAVARCGGRRGWRLLACLLSP